MVLLSINKYTALLIVLIILIIGYYFVGRGAKNTKKSKKKTKRTKRTKRRKIKRDDSQEDEESSDEEESEDRDTQDDAEELYNLIHEALCKDIQHDEFEEIVGDLAGPMVFIQLKQLYNQCIEKNLDPMRTITVHDYTRILKESDNE